MGITYTQIKVRNSLAGASAVELIAKVDCGATLLVLPGEIVREFNFPVIRRQNVKSADKRVEERDIVGAVEVEVCGRMGWFEAVVEPLKKYALLGAVVMESLDLIIEPRGQNIYPNPRSVLPMAEAE